MQIMKLKKGEVFVFGSNLNGAHAGGAALTAFQKFGAEMGVGEGMTGRSYAFPTLDKNMQKVSEVAFKKSVRKLYKTTEENSELTFLLTKVGCGIAGFSEKEIQGYFQNPPANLVLPEDWRPIVVKEGKVMYKFLREGMKSQHGNTEWKVGEWKKESNIKICGRGFHASDTPLEALGYVKGEIIAVVEGRGDSQVEEDKSCWEEMRVVRAYHWEKKDSVAFSIFASEQVLKNFEKVYPNDKRPRKAIEAARKWLANPTDANASAAASAAYSAAASAYSAAYSAARTADSAYSAARSACSAAYSAARSADSAADSAARSADSACSAAYSARSAARSADSAADSAARSADSALRATLNAWFVEHIKTLTEIV